MAEEIVACPGCAKKFRIPEGAPGGSFQCTACDATVNYGRPTGPARPAASSRSTRATRASRAKRAGGAATAAPARRATAAPARGAAEEDEEKVPYRPQRQELNPAIMWTSGIVLVVGVIALFFFVLPDATSKPPMGDAKKGDKGTVRAVTVSPELRKFIQVTKEPEVDADKEKLREQFEARRKWDTATDEVLLTTAYDNVEGMTAEERTRADEDVRLLLLSRGGSNEMEKVKAHGRKAMPSLLDALGKLYAKTKFEDAEDQYASYQIQKAMSEISKKDNPHPGTFAFSMPGITQKPAEFIRVSRVWASWWRWRGYRLATFKTE